MFSRFFYRLKLTSAFSFKEQISLKFRLHIYCNKISQILAKVYGLVRQNTYWYSICCRWLKTVAKGQTQSETDRPGWGEKSRVEEGMRVTSGERALSLLLPRKIRTLPHTSSSLGDHAPFPVPPPQTLHLCEEVLTWSETRRKKQQPFVATISLNQEPDFLTKIWTLLCHVIPNDLIFV